MSKYFVTGCNGFIGSVLCKILKEQGHTVYGYDKWKLRENRYVDHMYYDFYLPFGNGVDGIFYLGAHSILNKSISNPLEYYENNVGRLIYDLQTLNATGYDKGFIFASSAAVYGNNEYCKETDPTNPINPYGNTKLIGEQIIKDASKVGKFKYFNYRLFNVAGAYGDVGFPKSHPLIIPSLCRATVSDSTLFVQYGNNDRDYIHINDVCLAMISGMQKLNSALDPLKEWPGNIYNTELNICTGIRTSTDDLVNSFKQITKMSLIVDKQKPRKGDPNILIGDNSFTKAVLSWMPLYSGIGTIIEDAWNYFKEIR